jgi:hypothetical protein
MPYYRLPKSVFANIYTINKNAQDARLERLRVISLYDAYVDGNQAILDALRALKARLDSDARYTVKFVCWCAPEPCHGDVLKRRLLQLEDRQENLTQGKLF